MESPPSSPFEMPEPDFLFEFLTIALDTPTQLRQIYQTGEARSFGSVESKYFVGSSSRSGRLFQSMASATGLAEH
jgi:hypothetical protein